MRSQYGLIVVWVLILASIFIGAFFLKFGSWPTSDDPGDWADFATYLSGTVGVTAIVGTLRAFVITLRQQNELVESQKQIQIDQRRQIDISESQLLEAKRKDERDEAYANMRDILPLMLRGFDKSLGYTIKPPQGSWPREVLDVLVGRELASYELRNVIKKLDRLQFRLSNSDPSECESYINQILGNSSHLVGFLVENVSKNPALFYVADARLSENPDGDGWTYWKYVECFIAYSAGMGKPLFKEEYHTLLGGRKSYQSSDDRYLKSLFEIGSQLSQRD